MSFGWVWASDSKESSTIYNREWEKREMKKIIITLAIMLLFPAFVCAEDRVLTFPMFTIDKIPIPKIEVMQKKVEWLGWPLFAKPAGAPSPMEIYPEIDGTRCEFEISTDVEIGLRSDGVVVWRKIEKEK